MIKIDINAMLDTMSKGQIMAQIESQVDTAIAKRIEQETFAKHYNAAKARVADDTYTQGDLDILKHRLETIKADKREKEEAVFQYKPKTEGAEKITPTTKVVGSEEFNEIIEALNKGGLGRLFF